MENRTSTSSPNIPDPIDPFAAATHRDPYPYYRELVAHRPLHYDARTGWWIAAGAAEIEALLTAPACRVRPANEPVPEMLRDGAAGEVYARMVRMIDGPAQAQAKLAVQRALASLDRETLASRARRCAARLMVDQDVAQDGQWLSRWLLEVPVHVLGELLGIAQPALGALSTAVDAFVMALSPLANAVQIAAAHSAVEQMRAVVTTARGHALGDGGDSLQQQLRREAHVADWHDADAILANTIGLLSQTYEATAGLIGNTLIALARESGLDERVRQHPATLHAAIAEVSRHDAPVQNTRRFLAAPLQVGAHGLDADARIVLVLAAANRDPGANPQPDRFDCARTTRRDFTFGLGAHACPGRMLAIGIATEAVAALLQQGFDPRRDLVHHGYRPSVNARVPIFSRPAHIRSNQPLTQECNP